MPRPFARVHACSTNDHGADNDKIKGWIEHAGGTYTTCITPDTTHLLCSKTAWKRYSPLVKEARRSKKIKIVKLDWLIMSLTKHSKKAKNRPLPTTEWEWTQRKLIKSEQDQKSSSDGGGNDSQDTSSSPHFQRVMELEKMGRTLTHALQRLETKMSDNGYTLFTDAIGFKYSLALLRKDTHSTLAQYNVRHPSLPPPIHLPSTLHPCSLPLSLLPPGHVLACIPITTPSPHAHPRQLHGTRRRVPLSNPPFISLQLYASDETKPRFALASITVDGRGCAVTQDIAPMGSGQGFAMEMWRRVFLGRTGRVWQEGRWKGVDREGEWVWDGKEVVWQLDGGDDADGELEVDSDGDGAKACGTSGPSTTSAGLTKHRHTHTTPTSPSRDTAHPHPACTMANPHPRSPTPTASTARLRTQSPAKDASKRTLAGKVCKAKIAIPTVNGCAKAKATDRAKGVSKSPVESKGEGGFLARYLEGLK